MTQITQALDLNRHLEEIEEHGFSIVPDMIDKDQIAELIPAVERALEQEQTEFGGRPGKSEFIALDIVTKGPEFVRLMQNERMHAVFSGILGDGCVLYASTTTVLRPDQKHYTCEVHTDTGRFIENYTTGLLCTFALEDFTEDNGATYYLPGSHKHQDRPTDEEFYRDAVRVCRKAGDGVIFSNRVWHAGGINNTDSTRYGCSFYACRSYMKQRLDYPRMVSEDVLHQAGEVGRRFLGFNVRVPTSLGEFYVEPEQRLYKGGQG